MRVPTFIELCREELVLCGIGDGSTLAVLSQGRQRSEYVDAFLVAAEQLGAVAFNVNLPSVDSSLDGDVGVWEVGETPLAGNRPAIEALKGVDLVIDTVFLLFSREQLEIQASGTRILLCIEPIEHLRQMAPDRRLRERVEAGERLLSSARVLRFTNRHGSDVTYRLGAYPVITQYGYTDTPGRWDHWPSGFLFTGGADDGVDGRVMIAPGDIIFPFKSYVQTPIELTIEAGRIVAIEGGVDAAVMRDYMESFDDPNAYGISHIGWGLMREARWSGMATDVRSIQMEARSFYGNVLFSTGPNGELGGDNETACHIDVPMHGCSLWLDDLQVLEDGDVLIDSMRVEAPAAA